MKRWCIRTIEINQPGMWYFERFRLALQRPQDPGSFLRFIGDVSRARAFPFPRSFSPVSPSPGCRLSFRSLFFRSSDLPIRFWKGLERLKTKTGSHSVDLSQPSHTMKFFTALIVCTVAVSGMCQQADQWPAFFAFLLMIRLEPIALPQRWPGTSNAPTRRTANTRTKSSATRTGTVARVRPLNRSVPMVSSSIRPAARTSTRATTRTTWTARISSSSPVSSLAPAHTVS